MTSFAENGNEALTSIPPRPNEWPEIIVRDFVVTPNLGTQANPIVISDDPAPLGSASNPIVIHIDEHWCRGETDQLSSDADTEIMATPEFWEAWTHESPTVPAVEGKAVAPSPVHVQTSSSVCQDPEDLQPFRQSNRSHLDDEVLKVIGDDLATFSSASNPRAIYVNMDCDEVYHADVETNVTQELQNSSHRTTPTAPATKGEAFVQSPVRAPSRSSICEDLEGLGPCKQSPASHIHLNLDDKALKVTETSFDLLEDCSNPKASGRGNVINCQAEREQSTGNAFQAEEFWEARSVLETSSKVRDACPMETTDQSDSSLGKNLSCVSCDMRSTKRRLSHGRVPSELRRSARLTKRSRT